MFPREMSPIIVSEISMFRFNSATCYILICKLDAPPLKKSQLNSNKKTKNTGKTKVDTSIIYIHFNLVIDNFIVLLIVKFIGHKFREHILYIFYDTLKMATS